MFNVLLITLESWVSPHQWGRKSRPALFCFGFVFWCVRVCSLSADLQECQGPGQPGESLMGVTIPAWVAVCPFSGHALLLAARRLADAARRLGLCAARVPGARGLSERVLHGLLARSEISLRFMKVQLFYPGMQNLGGFLGALCVTFASVASSISESGCDQELRGSREA